MMNFIQSVITICALLVTLPIPSECALWNSDEGENVKVTAEIDLYTALPNQPLKGTITITHDVKAEVNENSFKLEKSPLKAEFVKNVKISPQDPLTISIYSFEIPGQPQGLYVLPEISVEVGGKVYSSIPTSYEVRKAISPPLPLPNNKGPPSSVSLTLKAAVDGPSPLYPGQRAWMVYRYYFNASVELVTEKLPLLEATGFQKIGDKRIKNYSEGGLNVLEVAQEIQAISPGEFKFPPSIVEGYAYQENELKQRTYLKPKLKSEAPGITITVVPFPESGKPASFNGAVGQFTLTTSLLTSATATVDEAIKLAVDISGADLATVKLPELNNLKSFFRLSDLPPIGEVKEGTKRFVVELSPLSTTVKAIPSIEFSYFDPIGNRYSTLHSPPIPITVKSDKEKVPEKQTPALIRPIPRQEQAAAEPAPIQIEGNYLLKMSDLQPLPFGTWSSFWIIPGGILVLAAQFFLKQEMLKKKQTATAKRSEDLFNEALQAPASSAAFFQLLNQAFLLRLTETGHLAAPNGLPEDRSRDDIVGEVRAFLDRIEEKRFTGRGEVSHETIIPEAKELFRKISSKKELP